MYWWNGRLLNANNWMNKQSQAASGTPNIPAFSNANQWATSFGGPIIKNKTFFFVDYEGMRFLLPNVDAVVAPRPQFIAAAVANVAAVNPGSSADYSKLMNFYATAPGYSGAVPNAPIPGDSCTSLVLPGFAAGTTPCS